MTTSTISLNHSSNEWIQKYRKEKATLPVLHDANSVFDDADEDVSPLTIPSMYPAVRSTPFNSGYILDSLNTVDLASDRTPLNGNLTRQNASLTTLNPALPFSHLGSISTSHDSLKGLSFDLSSIALNDWLLRTRILSDQARLLSLQSRLRSHNGMNERIGQSELAPSSLPSKIGFVSPGAASRTTTPAPTQRQHLPTMKPHLIEKDEIKETDVLCGRGGKSNHHPGNKKYRLVIGELRRKYRGTSAKTDKTALSRAIVDYVNGYGGRFLKQGDSNLQWVVLTKGEARKKTAQALRETKALKWTV